MRMWIVSLRRAERWRPGAGGGKGKAAAKESSQPCDDLSVQEREQGQNMQALTLGVCGHPANLEGPVEEDARRVVQPEVVRITHARHDTLDPLLPSQHVRKNMICIRRENQHVSIPSTAAAGPARQTTPVELALLCSPAVLILLQNRL